MALHSGGADGTATADEEASTTTAQQLADARRRAQRIDKWLDLIPARFYMGTARDEQESQRQQQWPEPGASLDPAAAKPTSRLVAEAAGASSSKKKRRKEPVPNGIDAEGSPKRALSRAELQEKLERRIAELKEERRRKQSDADKAKAAEVRDTRAASAEVVETKAAGSKSAAVSGKVTAQDAPELRLHFEPENAALPFGAERRGKKDKQLQEDLRKREAETAKLRKAGPVEQQDVRQEIAMRKALQRAQGQKVHDDLPRLRKAQKSHELKKKKGKQKWADRLEADKKRQQERQDARRENLDKRKADKRKNKRRPGFEGKHGMGAGYLNKEDK